RHHEGHRRNRWATRRPLHRHRAMYGAISVVIGLPLAAAGTRWFTDYAARMLNFSISSYAPPLWVTAVEVSVGLLVPLAAAWGPVRKGVRMSVVKALNATGMTETRFGHRLTDRILGSIRGLPRPVALSLRNTFLRKGRLILTLSTLTLASAMVMAVFGVQTSIKRTVDDLETYWGYNVQLSTAMPQEADGLESVVSGVDRVESVETWLDYRATVVRADGTENEGFTLVGLDPETDFVVPTVVEGRWLVGGDTNALVVNTDAQNEETSLSVGSEVTLSVLGEEETWRVVGVVKGQLGGAEVFCNESRLAEVLGTSDVSRVLVRGERSDADSEQELLDAVEERLADSGYQVTGARTRSGMAKQLGDLLGILVAFLLMAAGLLALVGLIGLTGTMTMNVLESTREIGVMRATGARHVSIYQIFMTEAITIGTMAWAAGAVLSYPLSLGLVWALGESIGVPLSFVFSWAGVGIWLALMLIISSFASVAPAFRASQVSVRDAIAYE
ncbi:MAG: ABC transporter permease, partial [Coriobacteriia bacterium]|nr:ABC transporter permease [Coriobacteriia bacterium]